MGVLNIHEALSVLGEKHNEVMEKLPTADRL